jgi:hypothetical protein
MIEKILTQNSQEEIRVKWDNSRIAIVMVNRVIKNTRTTILNPREAIILANFILQIMEGEKKAGRLTIS